jgi:aminopeptidase
VADPRLQKLAKVLVHYSLGVKKGDWVRINGSYLAEDLLREAYKETLIAGGHPSLNVGIPGVQHLFFKHATDEQLTYISPADRLYFKKMDKFLTVLGGSNTKELTGVDPQKSVAAQKARKGLFDTFTRRTAAGSLAWCGTQYPTASSAQDAEMALSEYEDFIFAGGLLDKKDPVAEWRKLSARQAKLVKALGRLKTIRIVGLDTDLTFNVAGRPWVNCDGHLNFPDGEVFTSPIENSAEGHIRYTFPAVYAGREVENVRLTFRKGKVVEAAADKGADLLHAMLGTDPGAKRVGELAFGTNPAIKRFTRNTLFDEKIGGTMHIAVGKSLPQSHGKNKSAIHWDMVCDTRKGFTIYGDGKPIHRNGKFLFG